MQIGQMSPMHTGSFQAGQRGEEPAAYYNVLPRPPDHQQPSRKGPRIPARPDMDTSVAPGFPTHLFTPVSPNPHSPVRPVFRMPSIRPWAGVCVRWHPGPHACPMHLGGRQVGVRDRGSAGGGGHPGATDVPRMAVDVRGVVLIYPAGASPLHPPCKEPTCRVRPRRSDGFYLVSSRRSSL